MNSKKLNNRKSKATLKKTKSGQKSNCRTKAILKNSTNSGRAKKILPDHEPYVWQWLGEGRTYEKTAELIKEKFGVIISMNGVYDYQRRHWSDWEDYLAKIKEVRLANVKARILERQRIVNKLRDKIIEILDMPPISWKDLNVASLIKEFNGLLEQIQDEVGDKVHKFKGEGMGGDVHQHNYFGDETVNKFADQAIEARAKETADSRNRIKAGRFSDSGNSLSDN